MLRGVSYLTMKERIYVCHTYYHVYVSYLKEFCLPEEQRGQASLVLSKMSTDFENLKERVEQSGIFEEVLIYDEKRDTFFPQLQKYRVDRGNIVANMLMRIIYTKKYAKLNAPYVPVNFRDYREIYVYSDADPIGYYLNWKHIHYHAMEDALNSLVNKDAARFDNRGHFGLKVFFSQKLNLIFIQNGYGKYCLDMEVNDIAAIPYPCPKYIELPRKALVDRLTQKEKKILLHVFVKNLDQLYEKIRHGEHNDNKILLLTEPLCDLKTRERIFRDIIEKYGKGAQVYIKPHPRDELDYDQLFGEYEVIDRTVPMEMLNYMDGVVFEKVIGVLTVLDEIQFAKEKIRLGEDFLDVYEDPVIHHQNDQI